jgi:hypothetical protein
LFQSSNLEPIEELALIEPLRATEKAKEAEIFTCKLCNGKYTDGSGSQWKQEELRVLQ